MARVRERIIQDDPDEARRLAHSLKGSSGNLGATEVQRLAGELEAAIKAGRDLAEVERLIGTLESTLQQLMPAILAALPEDTVSPSKR
jgi:two-component system sensor histidine kinase/response regulator